MQKRGKPTSRPRGSRPQQPQRSPVPAQKANKENLKVDFNYLMKIVNGNQEKEQSTDQDSLYQSQLYFGEEQEKKVMATPSPKECLSPVLDTSKIQRKSARNEEPSRKKPVAFRKAPIKQEAPKERRVTEDDVVRKARQLDQQMEAIQQQKTALLLRHYEDELDRELDLEREGQTVAIERQHIKAVEEVERMRDTKVETLHKMRGSLEKQIRIFLEIVKDLQNKEVALDQCMSAGVADLEERKRARLLTLEENFAQARQARIDTFKKYIAQRGV